MSIVEKIKTDSLTAMKNKDKETKSVLSVLLGNIQNAAIASGNKDASDAVATAAIKKELKIIQAQIDTCPLERVDLFQSFLNAKTIVEKYLPVQMTAQQVEDRLREVWTDGLNMGAAMKLAKSTIGDAADGKLVAATVQKILKGE